ncbi:MAG TPA: phosphoribosylformylglycinamidine synthase subunit PurL [Candidatus Binatia bacterium]|nr:phosphoribosylformylglycinamidine synthase subunit PurL [Candidatus Binatia bacterium]
MSAAPKLRPVDESLALEHGLTTDEYQVILDHLGRTPTFEELGVFSVMWSEHCSYKSSRVHLKRLPQSGPAVLQGPGENAGAVDIGGGMAAIFKIESHNHPSYIEPYQGAATGVGGILRDIFTMGARPVASMNSLRFGSPDHEKTPFLLKGVVAGVGGYGNSVGVATVGGEVVFDAGYNGNILVNAFTLGIVRADRIFKAVAKGTGNPVLYVGSKTGRDGIHGASLLASSEFKEESEQMKPTVQVGDPFTEKVLIEACLEVLRGNDVVAIQDMGAAGLTSSSVEMAARGEVGIRLELDRIPLRETDLTPYEMLLSESQERMLLVVHQGREEAVREVYSRWGLDCVTVGEITDSGRFEAFHHGQQVCSIPIPALTEAAPKYQRPIEAPAARPAPLDERALPVPSDLSGELLDLIVAPNLCSKTWVYRQYDCYVGANTIVRPGGDAAVVRVRETGGALAMSTDCNSRYCSLDPYVGAQHAVVEAARNVYVTGARPLAISDCLNFGSPEKPHVMWQFSRAIDGMADACKALEIAVISGNVSFYNDTQGASIPPTPTVSLVGLIEDAARVARIALPESGEIILLGGGQPVLEGSEYLSFRYGLTGDRPPPVDVMAERTLGELCRGLVADGVVTCAHDVSDGGIAAALAEMCMAGDVGADVAIDIPGRADTALFGESGCRILVAVDAARAEDVLARARGAGVSATRLGSISGERLIICDAAGSAARAGGVTTADVKGAGVRGAGRSALVDVPVLELLDAWRETLPAIALGEYDQTRAARAQGGHARHGKRT